MGLKSTLKLLLLFCSLNLILNQDTYNLNETIPLVITSKDAEKFSIQPNFNSKDYITIVYTPLEEGKKNPAIMVATNTDNCNSNRIALSTQYSGSIYIFLRKGQVDGKNADGGSIFAICTEKRESVEFGEYSIEVKLTNKAELPMGQQTSYFVDDYNVNMKFSLIKQLSEDPIQMSIWVRGKFISETDTKMNTYNPIHFDSGLIFFNDFDQSDNDLTVVSSKGDYVTVGSVPYDADYDSMNSLSIDGNEMTIYAEKRICFPIDFKSQNTYISGKLYSLKGRTYFADSRKMTIGTMKEITDGIISEYNVIKQLDPTKDKGFYCIEADNKIILTIQAYTFENALLSTPPAFPGEIRRYILKEGEKAAFSGIAYGEHATKENFNMKTIKGFPELYFNANGKFPDCSKDIFRFDHPIVSNRFSTYLYEIKKGNNLSPISRNQPTMYIECPEGNKVLDGVYDKFCEFEITIFTEIDIVKIMEDNTFSQFLGENEQHYYQIKIPSEIEPNKNSKIYLDLTIFSGDADIKVTSYTGGESNNYYLPNKVFCYIKYDKSKTDNLKFNVEAKKNTFYMVNYLILNQEINEDKNSIDSGVNYITLKLTENDSLEKSIYLKNSKYEDSQPFMASFYSPNCRFSAYWKRTSGNEIVPQFDNYANIIIDNKYSDFSQETYHFTYRIIKDDNTDSSKSFCMVAIAGLELPSKTLTRRSIALEEGVPHTFTFTDGYPLANYTYLITNFDNSVVVDLHLLDRAEYYVYLLINNGDFNNGEKIYRSKQLSISGSALKIKCGTKFKVCKIDINVLYVPYTEQTPKKVQIRAYQLDSNPIYLEKNRVTSDFLNGFHQKHYYFDITDKEYGDITLDFKRGSGNIYAKIVSTSNPAHEENPDWRGVYKFPTEPTDIEYSAYGKKLTITKADTLACSNGCYVLLTVVSNMELPGEFENEKLPFRITLNTRVIKTSTKISSPKVNIRLNEFIIGDILHDPLDNRKYDYYQIILPYDANEVIIDWQADSPAFLVNVGNDLPTIDDWDFAFPSFGDFVFKITRGDILRSGYSSQTASLEGIPLTIGIYANYSDSIKSSPYAFKMYMPPIVRDNEQIASQLIHIRSDQKVQCIPWKDNDYSYMCAFAVVFDEYDFKNNLVLYPKTNGKTFTKYGRLVKAEIVEKNDISQIIAEAEDIIFKKSTEGFTDNDLIYIEDVEKDNAYLLLTLFPNEVTDDKIEILSSTYGYENGMTFVPNPSTPQIFALKDKSIFFQFQTTDDLLINLHSLAGIGGFNWQTDREKDKIMFLRGREDRLSLTTTKDKNQELPKLNSTSYTSLLEIKTGFVFYITYYPRSYMDQLKPNSIGEIHYRTVKMPLNYFGHIGYMQPWTVNLNFYDIIPKNKGNEPLLYETDLFTIYGTVVPEMKIHEARYDERLRPKPTLENTFVGKFDSMFGVMFISEADIDRIMDQYPVDKVPYIFFGVNNTDPSIEYETIGLEADVHSVGVESGEYYAPEGIYITGKLKSVMKGKKKYRLKMNKKNEWLRLEYSTNSVNVKFALTSDHESETHSEFRFFETQDISGRKVLNVQLKTDQMGKDLFFVAFAANGDDYEYDQGLDYFVFKYLTANNQGAFLPIDCGIDDKISFKEDENEHKITISFQPVKYNDVSYFIKAIYTEDFIRGENVNSIAMSESKGMNLFINVPEANENLLTYDIPYNKDVLYVKVMAVYGLAEEKLIYLYKPVDISENRVQDSISLEKTNKMQNITLKSKYRIITAEVPEAGEKQKYQVMFENPDLLLEYVKVEVYNEERENSPMLCFSSSDPDCMLNRGQISKGGIKTTEFFIKKAQFLDRFYLTVQCQTTEGCSYNITISKMNEAVIDHMGIFNYYVSEGNKNMNFKFKNENPGEENGLLTLYATGGKNIILKFHDCDELDCIQHDFNGGAAIVIPSTNLEYYGVQVIAQAGDYISLGINFKKEGAVRELTPEMGETTGLLKKGLLNQVCYDLPDELDVFYITGRIFDGKAKIKYMNSNNEEITIQSSKYENGFFYAVYNTNFHTVSSLCFSLDKQEIMAYSVQIQAHSTFNGANFLPQTNGFTYPRIIPVGKTITLNSLIPKTNTGALVFNMIAKVGYPKMYTYDCDTYPLINVDDKDIENGVTKKVSDINGISTISTLDIPDTPIDAEQKLVVFKCHESKDNITVEDYQYCELLVTMFGESETIKLINKQPFGQYNTPGDINHYLIDLSSEEEKPTKVFIDFLVVTGDVKITIYNDDTNEEITYAHKYYLSNKIFYSVPVDDTLKKIRIETSSRINSYYLVEYKLIKASGEEITINYINSGINYLIPVETNKAEETIVIESLKISPPEMFFSSFYSLNCKFEITGLIQDTTAKIDTYGSYSQSVYTYKENEESQAKTFVAKIKEKNLIGDDDICMLYVSGLEYYKTTSGIRKEILISEGIPQKTIFTESLKKIRYVFPHADPSKNLTCSLNMLVPGKFGFRIFFREKEFNFDKVYSQSGIFFLKNDTIQQFCQNYELCSVTIEIENLETFNGESPIIEFSMKQEYNTPYYVERRILRKDYVTNDAHLFLYTDVGKSYSGYATIDFNRGSGYVYGKIVKKDQEISDENPHWRNYRFIKYLDDENSLEYDFYNKKILFTDTDTEKCDNGCFLLISVVSSVIKSGIREYDFSPFSILIDFNPETHYLLGGNKVEILPDEFIIGSLYSSVLRPELNIQNYSLICPYDADAIEIDWQTNVVQLAAEIDGYKEDFKNKGQSILVISKEMIYGEQQKDNNSLKDKELKLKISTQQFETHSFAVYSFRVHFRRKEINIHKATSDQKILCKPEIIESGNNSYYRCLLAVVYKDTELFNDLMIYAKSKDPSSKIDMYGAFIDREIYDGYNVEELQKNIPTQGAPFDTKTTKTNFLFIKYGDFDKHVFVSIVSNSEKDIEILTSFMTLEILLEPNPRSPQIYPMDLLKKEIHINFLTKKSLAINLMSLHGEAKISLEQDNNGPFYLRGDEDNLKYIVKSDSERVNTDLTVENLRYSDLDYQNPGCAFILEFFLRIEEEELDSLKIGETTEFGYQDISQKTDIYYYAKVTETDKDVTAFFYLHDLIYLNPEVEGRTIKNDEFLFKAMVVPETRIFDIKNGIDKIPQDFYLQGVFDTTLKAGSIYVPKSNFNGVTNPVILLTIRKNEKYHLDFLRFRGEIGLNYINSDVPVIQNSYQLGKIEGDTLVNYKLKTDSKFSKYVRIQFSANSEYVDFAINQEKDQKVNGTFEDFDDKRERGITFVTLKRPDDAEFLYLTIFLTTDSKNKELKKLNNYIFKYMNGETNSFYEFKIVNNNPKFTTTKENGEFFVKFNTINTEEIDIYEPNIIYTVKLVPKETFIEDEKSDLIAITESPAIAQQYKHLPDTNEMSVKFKEHDVNYTYAQIIATITKGSYVEYVTYQAIDMDGEEIDPSSNPEPLPTGEEKTDTTKPSDTDKKSDGGKPLKDNKALIAIIVVSCFLFIVVVVLVVVIVMYNSKNKDLLTQVNKISFVQSGASAKDDANLLLDNQNELD